MTLEQTYNQGYVAGINGCDPRVCPFDKMTAEARAWHQGQRWGAQLYRGIAHTRETST